MNHWSGYFSQRLVGCFFYGFLFLALIGCETTNVSDKHEVRIEFIGDADRDTSGDALRIDIYFAHDEVDKKRLHVFLAKRSITKKDRKEFLRKNAIQYHSVIVQPNQTLDKVYLTDGVPDTIYIKYSNKHDSDRWSFKTVSGQRYKTILKIVEGYVSAEQTPF